MCIERPFFVMGCVVTNICVACLFFGICGPWFEVSGGYSMDTRAEIVMSTVKVVCEYEKASVRLTGELSLIFELHFRLDKGQKGSNMYVQTMYQKNNLTWTSHLRL